MECEESSIDNVKKEFMKTCEMCFKILDDDSNCELLDKSLKDIIEILFIKADVNINGETVICLDCSNNLREAFNFKTTCIETEDMLVPLIETNGRDEIDISRVLNNSDHSPVNESNEKHKYCRLCRNLSDSEFMVSFDKFLEDPKITEVFEKHIPELNFMGVKDPLVCSSCQKIVKNLSTFLSITTKISQGIALDDHQLPLTNSFPVEPKDTQELNNITYKKQLFNGQWIYIKTDPDEISTNNHQLPSTTYFTVRNEKNKPSFQPCYKRIILNDKWVYVKVDPDDEIFKKSRPKRIRKQPRKMYTCDKCGFQTKNIQSHRLLHQDLSSVRNFKCSECSFVSKYLHSIKRHMKIHKQIAENFPTRTKLHKCTLCDFQTINMKDIGVHIKTNHNLERKDVIKFKCPHCKYESASKHRYDLHLQKHQRENNEGKRKCNLCDYWTRFKNHLRRHMAYHEKGQQQSGD